MGDQFDGDRIHQALKAPLGGEALAETRIEQMVLEPEPEPAGDDHALRPVCEREIARDRAEREAEAIERGNREIVLAFQRRSEEHTSELQSLMRISYAVFCCKTKTHKQPDSSKNPRR